MDLRGQCARIACGVTLLVAVFGAPGRAHFLLVAPDSWMSQGPLGDPQKLGPCGDEGGGTATGKVTAFRPGETIEVAVDEKIHHPGHYRVALAVEDRSELPPDPAVTAVGADPCGSVEIQDPPIFPILADNMLPHTQVFDGPQTFTVTLPQAVTCTRCTLQIIEYMSQHPRPCFYHHCADISIQGDLETPTPTPTPTQMATPTQTNSVAPTPTRTVTSPNRCAGDCDESGSVTIDELVTLVGIAFESMPIETCEAGNPDGNREIALNEIVTAVSSALRGCASAVPAVHAGR